MAGKKPEKSEKGAVKSEVLAERPGKSITRRGNLVFKAFEKGKSKADILNEALNQARAEQAGLPAPALREVRANKDGSWAIVMDYVEGRTLDDLMKKDRKNFDKHLETFVRIHTEVLAHKVALMNPLTEKLDRQVSASALPEEQRYNLHMQLMGLPKNISVCHGDFNPTNVIMLPDGSHRILDWAHVRRGNALADIARTYLYFAVTDQLPIGEKYLDAICARLKVEKRDVQKWLPIVAAAQSTKEENAKHVDLLLHWASVVDYV